MDITKHKRVVNRTAGGQTTINSGLIDTAGYDRIKITALYGDIATSGACAIKLQHGNAADGSDLADVEGSAVALADGVDENTVVIHDIILPQKRYLKHFSARSGGNVEIDAVLVEFMNGHIQPESLDSSIKVYKQMGSPNSGTP